jgi:hypothetical protein
MKQLTKNLSLGLNYSSELAKQNNAGGGPFSRHY